MPLRLRILSGLAMVAAGALAAAGCGRFSFSRSDSAEAATENEPPMVSVTLAAQGLELFMEHPYLVQGVEAKFNVHLTVLEDGAPIRSGKLSVVAEGPSGKTVTVEQPAPRSPGIFGPVVAFPEAGLNEMSLTLESDQARETIRVPVTVYADQDAAHKAADEAAQAEPEGAIQFLKEQAWKIRLITQPVEKRRMVERLEVPGEIVPAAGAMAVVTSPLEGRVLPPPKGAFPRVGQRVEAGQVVAVIEPPLAGPQGVQLLVNQAQIQSLETELAVKEMDVEVEIKKAKVELDHARAVFERLQSLSNHGVAAGRQSEQAERELRIAEANYEGKLDLRQPYQEARQRLQAMLVPGATGGDTYSREASSSASPAALQLALRAPISGIVTAATATAGEFVDATRALFTVVNLERVWIEAKVSEYDLERVTKAPAATFTLAAYPDRRFTILDSNGGQLIDIGKVVDAQSRTVVVRYEIANSEGLLRVGMFADVGIETKRTEQTMAIPESAIIDEDGRPTAYVALAGESFQKRDLELGIRDSGFVEVQQGLEEGERVVARGAYAIRLASVSSVIPAHGHTH